MNHGWTGKLQVTLLAAERRRSNRDAFWENGGLTSHSLLVTRWNWLVACYSL